VVAQTVCDYYGLGSDTEENTLDKQGLPLV